jgi:hypothetical protein
MLIFCNNYRIGAKYRIQDNKYNPHIIIYFILCIHNFIFDIVYNTVIL